MTVFQTIAILLVFAALGAYINRRFLKLPAAIGLMVFALVLSMFASGFAFIGLIDLTGANEFVSGIDFSGLLLHGMLSFLLFAGAMQVDLSELKKSRAVVAVLASVGVVITTFVTGTIVWLSAKALGFPFPYTYALLFGALIAPTDPVAVLGVLKQTGISKTLRAKIASESLLNDGVAVVTFLVILGIATAPPTARIDPYNITMLLAWQSVGGFALGLSLGWLTYQLLNSIDDYKVEVLLTVALASGGYALAEFVHVSAPIAMVVAGIVLGTQGESFGLKSKIRKHLDMFWELLDEILNAILFLLMGLVMMVITINGSRLAAGLAAIIAVLIGRWISVGGPVVIMRLLHYRFERGTVRLMTWGGLRGGVSIAMALSLPPGPEKEIILGMTYLVVVFSVLFQGTTFRHIVDLVSGKKIPL